MIVALLMTGRAVADPVTLPATFPGAQSLLWVGAHPDDEVLVAPLLGRLCRDEGLSCTLLVFTKGEAGECRLAGGCQPDLGTVRFAEMRRSARLLDATLRQWSLPDGGGRQGWTTAIGGLDILLARLTVVLSQVRPDVVLTFDPRHGSTCHADHRAVGQLVLEVAAASAPSPSVYLLETRVRGTVHPFDISLGAGADVAVGAFGFDANQPLSVLGGEPAWRLAVGVARLHRSQFDAAAVTGLARLAPAQRAVYIAPAALALAAGDVEGCAELVADPE